MTTTWSQSRKFPLRTNTPSCFKPFKRFLLLPGKDQIPLYWLLPGLQVCPLPFRLNPDTGVFHLNTPVCLAYHTAETLKAKLDPEFTDPSPNSNPSWRGILRCLQRPDGVWGVIVATCFEILSFLGSEVTWAHLLHSSVCFRLKMGGCPLSFPRVRRIKIYLESNNSQILRAGRTVGNHLTQLQAFRDGQS